MALETQFHSNHTDKMHACPHKVVQDFMMPCQTITLLPPALQLLLPLRHIALILFISRDILYFISCLLREVLFNAAWKLNRQFFLLLSFLEFFIQGLRIYPLEILQTVSTMIGSPKPYEYGQGVWSCTATENGAKLNMWWSRTGQLHGRSLFCFRDRSCKENSFSIKQWKLWMPG